MNSSETWFFFLEGPDDGQIITPDPPSSSTATTTTATAKDPPLISHVYEILGYMDDFFNIIDLLAYIVIVFRIFMKYLLK